MDIARRLKIVLFAFALTVASALVFAYSVTPGGVAPVGPSGGGYMGQGSWYANGNYYSSRVTYSGSTIAGAARAALRGAIRFTNAAGIIYTVFQAAGWLYENGILHKNDGSPQSPLGPGAYCLGPTTQYGGTFAQRRCTTLKADVCNVFNAIAAASWHCNSIRTNPNHPQGSGSVVIDVVGPGYNGGVTFSWIGQPAAGWTAAENANPGTAGTPVTDAELNAALYANPQAMQSLLNDSNGRGQRFPEFVAAENALRDALAQRDGAPVGTTGQGTADPDTAEEPQGPAPDPQKVDLPAFCTWAKVVCDFITWFKTEETTTDVVLPEESLAIEPVEWDGGLGSDGTCPAPVTTMVWGQELAFSYEPACEFADLMRLIIIAMGGLLAAYILAGLRQTNA